jgi:hypothetical protein
LWLVAPTTVAAGQVDAKQGLVDAACSTRVARQDLATKLLGHAIRLLDATAGDAHPLQTDLGGDRARDPPVSIAGAGPCATVAATAERLGQLLLAEDLDGVSDPGTQHLFDASPEPCNLGRNGGRPGHHRTLPVAASGAKAEIRTRTLLRGEDFKTEQKRRRINV